MSIADKLQYTLNAKNAIKDALVAKGAITGTEPFSEYAEAVAGIKGVWDEIMGADCTPHGDIVLPDSLTHIGDSAFFGCNNLTGITIPSSVTSIGNDVLRNCSKLERVILNEGLITIGNNSIMHGRFETIVFPSTLTTVGNSLLYNANLLVSAVFLGVNKIGTSALCIVGALRYVELPSTITEIGRGMCNQAENLTTFICKAATPPALGEGCFYKSTAFKIYVPDASVDAYKAATNWVTYADRILPLSQLPV